MPKKEANSRQLCRISSSKQDVVSNGAFTLDVKSVLKEI